MCLAQRSPSVRLFASLLRHCCIIVFFPCRLAFGGCIPRECTGLSRSNMLQQLLRVMFKFLSDSSSLLLHGADLMKAGGGWAGCLALCSASSSTLRGRKHAHDRMFLADVTALPTVRDGGQLNQSVRLGRISWRKQFPARRLCAKLRTGRTLTASPLQMG